MIKGKFQSAVIASLLLAASNANATLEPRLNGQAYYDTETNLTWTSDMSRQGSSFLYEDQSAFVSNLVIEGVGNWRIPTMQEMWVMAHHSADCSSVMFCDQIDHQYFSIADWFTFYWFAGGYPGGGYRPATNEVFPTWEQYHFPVWPVHTGDVAAISAVPEISTYAMFLAGLGLLGFMAPRKAMACG